VLFSSSAGKHNKSANELRCPDDVPRIPKNLSARRYFQSHLLFSPRAVSPPDNDVFKSFLCINFHNYQEKEIEKSLSSLSVVSNHTVLRWVGSGEPLEKGNKENLTAKN
jgi:hypothetical protein